MQSLIVLVCTFAAALSSFSPKVCQKTKGLRMALLPDSAVCNKNMTKAYKVDVDIKVEDYTERATQGYLLYKIKSVCDVYENLLTATRVNPWTDPQPVRVFQHRNTHDQTWTVPVQRRDNTVLQGEES